MAGGRGAPSVNSQRHILFTAFEPSGDAVAAPLIAALRRRHPELHISALGGPRMRAAGAEIIEDTTTDPVMGLGAARKAMEHRQRLQRLRTWMLRNPLAMVVPTDSPAANWAVCRAARELGKRTKVIHLVAPQLWAWAPWRIRRMRKLSDHALCLLPFEPSWFASRGVPATFVGHPLYDEIDAPPPMPDPQLAQWSAGTRLALLPGSRSSEVMKNLPTMLRTLAPLRDRVGRLTVVIAASDDIRERLIRDVMRDTSAGEGVIVHHVVGKTDAALRWSDAVLVCSGTATLQVAAHKKPMVILYNVGRLMWHGLGRWIVTTNTFSLPNLIGEHLGMGKRVPEFIPHFGDPAPVVEALAPLLVDMEARREQLDLFDAIAREYDRVTFAEAAADVVRRYL